MTLIQMDEVGSIPSLPAVVSTCVRPLPLVYRRPPLDRSRSIDINAIIPTARRALRSQPY